MNRITSDDVKSGRISPKIVENGVVVPPNLQVNHLTVAEHKERLLHLYGTQALYSIYPEERPDER